MTDAKSLPGPLAGLRVLELADEKGQFCGKLMGDLGADVIKIEPPGGERCRHLGPFLDDVPDPERSLSFWYYNTSKRAITLDLATADGRGLFVAYGRHGGPGSGNLSPRLPGFARAWPRRHGARESAADHVLADTIRSDRPVAGLSLQRSAAHGGRRRDGLLRL